MKAFFTIIALFFIVSCGTAYDQYSPGAMLKKYEWFKNQYQSALQIEARLNVASKELEYYEKKCANKQTLTYVEQEKYEHARNTYQGYVSQYDAIAAEYNAQASKFNWSAFKTGECPFRLEMK